MVAPGTPAELESLTRPVISPRVWPKTGAASVPNTKKVTIRSADLIVVFPIAKLFGAGSNNIRARAALQAALRTVQPALHRAHRRPANGCVWPGTSPGVRG